ncbi:MAG: Holliday junction resolvase-like protein [Acidilobus sp.]
MPTQQLYLYALAILSLVELIAIGALLVRLKALEGTLRAVYRSIDAIADSKAKQMAERAIQEAREEAIKRSSAVITGKVYEQLAPLFPGFRHNPREARFIGSPIDFIVFDGLESGGPVTITLVEVKSSSDQRLTDRERAIKEAIERRSVRFELLTADELLRGTRREPK